MTTYANEPPIEFDHDGHHFVCRLAFSTQPDPSLAAGILPISEWEVSMDGVVEGHYESSDRRGHIRDRVIRIYDAQRRMGER